MKKLLLLSSLIIGIILIGANITISKINQPPSGKTGAPGEGSCSDCHGTTAGSGNGISVNFNNPGGTFYNDSTYLINLTVDDASAMRFGFELTALDASGNKAGDFMILNTSNTSLQNASNRQYVGHMSASSLNNWTFEWKAPDVGSGVNAVNFYAYALGANGTGSTAGDVIYNWNTTHSLSSNVGIQDSEYLSSVFMYSENHNLNIQVQSFKNIKSLIEIYNLNGQIVFSQLHEILQGYNDISIDQNQLEQGLYVVRLYGANFNYSQKLIFQ